jgi:hypothetical protein
MTSVVGYLAIKAQIVAILETITSLKEVYGKEPKTVTQFPAACVSADSDDEQFDSVGANGTNEAVYRHFVRIYFRTDENNDADYEDVLEGVVDAVKAKFRQNISLHGTCEYSIPSSGRWGFTNEKETPMRYYEMVVSSTVHVRRDTGQLV